MKKIKLTLLLLTAISSHAFSEILYDVTPTLVGTQFNGAMVTVGVGNAGTSCTYNTIYFKDEKELGSALSIAMASYIAKQTIRIDYEQPDGENGQCHGTGIYLR